MKIGVVGCGQVGAASAFACVLQGVGTEIVLCDHVPDFARAQAEDIFHASPFGSGVNVISGDYNDLEGAQIIIIAAGVPQKNDSETRLDLLKRNAEVFHSIIPNILKVAPEAILLIASNPVDVITHLCAEIAHETCRHPSSKVIGTGTILDTARFRTLLASHLGVSSHSVHAYVLGEHGDSEILQWSTATIGNMPLGDFSVQVNAPVTEQVRAEIDASVRNAAYRIIKGKGATWFGIGAGIARLAKAVIHNQKVVLTCCTRTDSVESIRDVTVSLPRIVSRHGIEQTMYPVLSKEEQADLQKSAEIIKQATDAILIS